MNKQQAYAYIEDHYRNNFDRLVKQWSRSLNSQAKAEDAVQEAYTKALTYWQNMGDDFDKWFGMIITNCVRDVKREDLMHGMTTELEAAQDIPEEPEAIPAIIRKQVERLIDKKEKATANILRLALIYQYRPEDIAGLIGTSSNAVRQTIHRFRTEIREKFHQ